MLIKTLAYFITHSNAILTDALESVINIVAGSFALYSLIVASKPRDLNHPYGHGKIEFISASIEGTLIIGAGISMIIKAMYNLVYPHEISSIDIGIYLTGGAGLVNFILGGILLYEGNKNNSMIMQADGKHLISDGYSTVGMIIGLAIVYFSQLIWIDNIVAILFGLIIAITGLRILKKSLPGIMDEADMKVLEEIVNVLQHNRKDNWIDLHNLRLIKYGSVYHVDCHMTMPWYFTVKEAHEENLKVEQIIQKYFGEKAEMFIHFDPCKTSSCKICKKSDCKVREREFEKQLTWSLDNSLTQSQHKL